MNFKTLFIASFFMLSGMAKAAPADSVQYTYYAQVCWATYSSGLVEKVDIAKCRGPGVEYTYYAGSCWAEYTSGYREDVAIEYCRS